jgi:hypothetical protein
VKILKEEHIPNRIKDGHRYYCRYLVVDKSTTDVSALKLYDHAGCIYTEAQMRAAESIPAGMDLSDGTDREFEWMKVGAEQKLVVGQDLEVWILYRPDVYDSLLYKRVPPLEA